MVIERDRKQHLKQSRGQNRSVCEDESHLRVFFKLGFSLRPLSIHFYPPSPSPTHPPIRLARAANCHQGVAPRIRMRACKTRPGFKFQLKR